MRAGSIFSKLLLVSAMVFCAAWLCVPNASATDEMATHDGNFDMNSFNLWNSPMYGQGLDPEQGHWWKQNVVAVSGMSAKYQIYNPAFDIGPTTLWASARQGDKDNVTILTENSANPTEVWTATVMAKTNIPLSSAAQAGLQLMFYNANNECWDDATHTWVPYVAFQSLQAISQDVIGGNTMGAWRQLYVRAKTPPGARNVGFVAFVSASKTDSDAAGSLVYFDNAFLEKGSSVTPPAFSPIGGTLRNGNFENGISDYWLRKENWSVESSSPYSGGISAKNTIDSTYPIATANYYGTLTQVYPLGTPSSTPPKIYAKAKVRTTFPTNSTARAGLVIGFLDAEHKPCKQPPPANSTLEGDVIEFRSPVGGTTPWSDVYVQAVVPDTAVYITYNLYVYAKAGDTDAVNCPVYFDDAEFSMTPITAPGTTILNMLMNPNFDVGGLNFCFNNWDSIEPFLDSPTDPSTWSYASLGSLSSSVKNLIDLLHLHATYPDPLYPRWDGSYYVSQRQTFFADPGQIFYGTLKARTDIDPRSLAKAGVSLVFLDQYGRPIQPVNPYPDIQFMTDPAFKDVIGGITPSSLTSSRDLYAKGTAPSTTCYVQYNAMSYINHVNPLINPEDGFANGHTMVFDNAGLTMNAPGAPASQTALRNGDFENGLHDWYIWWPEKKPAWKADDTAANVHGGVLSAKLAVTYSSELTCGPFTVTGDGSTVTVISTYPHGLNTGAQISMNNWLPAGFNGTPTVTANVAEPFKFTYSSSTATGTATGGTINRLASVGVNDNKAYLTQEISPFVAGDSVDAKVFVKLANINPAATTKAELIVEFWDSAIPTPHKLLAVSDMRDYANYTAHGGGWQELQVVATANDPNTTRMKYVLHVTVNGNDYVNANGGEVWFDDATLEFHYVNHLRYTSLADDFPMEAATQANYTGAASVRMALLSYEPGAIDPYPPASQADLFDAYHTGTVMTPSDIVYEMNSYFNSGTYNYTDFVRTPDPLVAIANFVYWIDFLPGHADARCSPAFVPQAGSYDHWRLVRGIVTNTKPLDSQSTSFTVESLWVNNPLPVGIGAVTWETLSEFMSTYLPTDGSNYESVYEPPINMTPAAQTAFTKKLTKAIKDGKIKFASLQPDPVLAKEVARIEKAAINGKKACLLGKVVSKGALSKSGIFNKGSLEKAMPWALRNDPLFMGIFNATNQIQKYVVNPGKADAYVLLALGGPSSSISVSKKKQVVQQLTTVVCKLDLAGSVLAVTWVPAPGETYLKVPEGLAAELAQSYLANKQTGYSKNVKPVVIGTPELVYKVGDVSAFLPTWEVKFNGGTIVKVGQNKACSVSSNSVSSNSLSLPAAVGKPIK